MGSFGKQPECGLGVCRPKCMRKFATVNWFTGIYSISGLLTASLSMYVVSQVSTIERQFGLSSSKTGYLMACNDIGYSVFILIGSYFANRVHIPKFLCLSTMLYGISGILCSVPHFLYKPALTSNLNLAQTPSRFSSLNLCTNSSELELQSMFRLTNRTFQAESLNNAVDNTARNVTMALIAIGMIIQGIGKAPRFPMLGQYLDDNTNDRETGFYVGIISSVAIFGPAIAYGLGGFFSQLYVTLEDVDLHPLDPRWLGAWWLGFLAFGVAAILCAIPLAFFPSSLRVQNKATNRAPKSTRKPRVAIGAICRELSGVFKSTYKVLRVPAFTVMLVTCICNVLGMSAGFSFGPKYLENQFNMPAWKSNIILAGFGIPSICIGSFVGGLITKKLKLNPLKCVLLILSTQLPALGLQLVAMFLGCDQPQIHNWPDQRNPALPTSCSSDCGCDRTFLPVCDSQGNNYFSPCHAGCSQGSMMKFTNCSCISGGEVSTGLCKFDCNAMWPFLAVTFIGSFLTACMMMPTFVYNMRIVKDHLKSMAIGLSSLCMSLFAWLPGPVIGGKLVDHACLLWSDGDSGSCTFYNLYTLRYNLFGFAIASRCVAMVTLIILLRITWNMGEWSDMETRRSEEILWRDKKNKTLTDKSSYPLKSTV